MTTNGEDGGPTESETTTPASSNLVMIALAVVVVILVGVIAGFIVSGGLSDDPASELAEGSTTVAADTTVAAPSTTTSSTSPPTTQVPGQVTVPAIEDTWIDALEPEDINGLSPILEIEDDPPEIKTALVRFDVTGVPEGETISEVILQFSTISAGSQVAVHLVDGEWNEAETNASNAPLLGARVGIILPQGEQGTLAEVDVTGVVTGPGPIDFYLTALGDDTTEYASRDAGTGVPVLIVRWGS
ncbi:MAG TPA: DNRLRE domain-containing protein [Acidimicrobiia bacterium]|nr:DNRLRE domain-containing protein [Acidimicrobiia bacterium]